ncbi:ABC transporter substrate-binding protein [Variovorax sp. VNK109]|uniref:ABC transporter substrate-binding protein n=1 Tax=Variovorax sp. VNK109 TaxID=3400919 RepID=UPI003C10266D
MGRTNRWLAAALLAAGFTHSAFADDRPEFRIGMVNAVTGGASAIAAGAVATFNLLEQQLAADKSLPFQVKFIKYDDGSDPAKSINAVRRLAQEDKVHVIICCTTTPSSLAVNKAIDEEKVPNVSLAAAASVIEPASERKYTFKTPITDRLMINYTLDYMLKKGYRKVAFLGLDDSYGEGGWVEFNKLAAAKGMEIVATERFSRGDTNFTPQALRVSQKKPDAVYFHAIPPSAALAHETLKRVGYAGPIFHGGGAPTPAFLSVGKTAVEGAIVGTASLTIHDQLPANHPLKKVQGDFAKSYDAKYGAGKADLFAAQAYDAIQIPLQAWSRVPANVRAGDLAQARNALRDNIENTKNYLGAVGIFSFSPTDHLGLDSRSTFLVTVKDGKFTLLADQ